MTARIDRLWPEPADDLSDDDIVDRGEPGVRVNFISSVDGAATTGGLSGGLGDDSDHRRFELLRRAADVVVVGAGTVRAEGYGPLRVSDASARWRSEHGLPEHPVFAIVSGSLDLDPASRIFTEAPVRPIVVTMEKAQGVDAFADVADVIIAGAEHADLPATLAALTERGLVRVLCEGGPSLFGSLLAVDRVDELYLTVAPRLEAGDARRIASGDIPQPRHLALRTVLRSGDTLLLTYARPLVE
ncbi:MAG: pyrimidine reductase family protein [Rhodoglobus sp.]